MIRLTHFVRWDDIGITLKRALCGLIVSVKDHSNDPTCPACAAILAEREATSP
jgi:hypothetical protein